MNNVFKQIFVKGKTAALLLLGAVLFIMTGCKEEEPSMISVSPANIQIGIETQSIPVEVRSNTHWVAEVTQGADWCFLSHTQGYGTEMIHLNVHEYNESPRPRTAVIRVSTSKGKSAHAQIMVTQSADNSTLMISPETIDIDNKAQTIGMAIASNEDWTITPDKPDMISGSLSATSGNGNATINIPVAANTGHDDRTLTLTVIAGTGSRTVTKTMTINQSGMGAPTLFLSETSLEFTAEEDEARVIAITNIQGELKVSCDFSWCVPTIDETDNRLIKVSVEPNNENGHRDAIVTVIGEVDGQAVTQQIRVTQAGVGSPVITLVSTNVQVNHGTHTITVAYIKNNASITVTPSADASSASWITDVDKGTETGVNGTVTFEVAANDAIDMRQGVVNVVAAVGGESLIYPINVLQSGVGAMEMQVYPSVANVDVEGEEKVSAGFISEPTAVVSAVATDGSTVMFASAPVVTGPDENGAFTVEYIVTPNTGHAARTATVMVTATKGTQTVAETFSVIQAGLGSPDLTVVSEVVNVPQGGAIAGDRVGTQLIGATASTTIPTVNIGGFTATADGTPIDFIEITAAANGSADPISQVINMVATQGGASQVFSLTIVQAGTGSPQLTIPQANFEFTDMGAEDFGIIVQPDAGTTYSVLSKPSWVSAAEQVDETNVMNITVDENTTSEVRVGDIYLEAVKGGHVLVYSIGIVQNGIVTPNLTLATADVYAAAEQTSVSVGIVGGNSDDYSFTYGVADQSWITNSDENANVITLTLTENTGLESRTQTVNIQVTRAGLTQTLTLKVTQAGANAPSVIPGATALQFGPDAEDDVAIHLLNEGATPATVTAKSYPSWITGVAIASPYDVLTFDVAANDTHDVRSGVISLEAVLGDQKAQITITVSQSARGEIEASLSVASINLDENELALGDGPSIFILHLSDEVTAELASISDPWLEGTEVDGSELNVAVSQNTGAARTGTVIVKVTDNVSKAVQYLTLVVNQAGTGTPVVADLQVTPRTVTIPVDGSAVTVNLANYNSTDYTNIATTASDSWIIVDPTIAATTFDISAAANTGDEKTGAVELLITKSNGTQQAVTINVIQSAAAVTPDLVASPTNVSVLAAGETQSISFTNWTSTTDYPAVAATASDNWITVPTTNIAAANFDITVVANTGAERSGTVTLTVTKANGTQAPITINVTQEAAALTADLQVTPTSLTFGAATSSHTVSFPNWADVDYPSIMATASDNWITVPTASIVADNFVIEVADNSGVQRSGTVTLTITKANGTQAPVTITVTQDALTIPDLVLSADDLDFLATPPASAREVKLLGWTSTTDYPSADATSNSSWISTTDYNDGVVTVNVEENTTEDPRTATVTVQVNKANGTQQTLTINVTQEAAPPVTPPAVPVDLVPDYSDINFDAAGATAQAVKLQNYTNDTDYTSITNTLPSWITLTPGTDASEFELVPTGDNTTGSTRTAPVSLTVTKSDGSTQNISINVTQPSVALTPDLHVAPTSMTLVTAGTARTVSLPNYTGTTDYPTISATSSDGWLIVSAASITADNFTISADPNEGAERTGTVTLNVTKANGTQAPITITVTQDAKVIPDLALAQDDLDFLYQPDASPREVKLLGWNDTDYLDGDAATHSSWITTSEYDATNGVVNINVEENTTTAVRNGSVTVHVNKANGTTQTITINVQQEAPVTTPPAVPLDLVPDYSDIHFTQAGATAQAVKLQNYTNDTDYTSITNALPSWITLTPGVDASEFTLAPKDDNTTGSTRTATVNLTVTKSDGSTQNIAIDVTQLG